MVYRTKAEKKDPEGVAIAIDFGSTMPRILAGKESNGYLPELITFPPYVVEMPKELLQRLNNVNRDDNRVRRDIDTVLSELFVSADKSLFYLVGEMAERSRSNHLCLGESKYINAKAVILASVGFVLESMGLLGADRSPLLRIGGLLPWSERGDTGHLRSATRQALEKGYRFRYITLQMPPVPVIPIRFAPEGAGVVLQGLPENSEKKGLVLAVVIGFRNLSLVFFKGGKTFRGITTDMGMSWLVERMGVKAKAYDPIVMATAVARAGSKINETPLKPLINKRLFRGTEREREAEMKLLINEIKTGRELFLREVRFLLGREVTESLDAVIVTGGTSYGFRNELKTIIKETTGITPVRPKGLEDRVEQLLTPKMGKKVKQEFLPARLADLYGFYYELIGRTLPPVESLSGGTR